MKYIAYLILTLTIGLNLYLYYPETKILADPNDNAFQYSLVNRTNWVWINYGCPFSLSCLPNLVDHNVPNWAEGYPLPFYYSHVPQIAIVASYNLFIKPLSALYPLPFTLYQYYNLTKYLLLAFFPISVFIALRVVGFSPIIAALGAFFSAHFSTDGLYGIDPPSFLWRGYGLTSQLYAIFFLPLGIAFTFRALNEISKIKNQKSKIQSKNQYLSTSDLNAGDASGGPPIRAQDIGSEHEVGVASSRTRKLIFSDQFWSVLFLTLTTVGHLGIGIIGILSTLPFLFLDIKPKNIILRFKKLSLVLGSLFFVLSYWIIPILLNNNYHIVSFWDPIWKFNSYGWYEVIRQFFQGEIFDWGRAPILTILTFIGFFTLVNTRLFPFALVFSFFTLMYFGRTTWGGLIDLIPGMKDFHQHRFIVGIHIASLFLIPAGLEWILNSLKLLSNLSKLIYTLNLKAGGTVRGAPSTRAEHTHLEHELGENRDRTRKLIITIISITLMLFLSYFTIKQTINYASLNTRWIGEANTAYRYDEGNFNKLRATLDSLPPARIYTGRPGNWGKEFRLGSSQMYLLMGTIGYDISQFLPETWSMLSENEQNFDERVAGDYNLLNIRYIISPKNQGFTESASLKDKYGPFELYEIPTTGWFETVSSPMFVKANKANFINLVHYWHRSYPRLWKMHPLISVEASPDIPNGMQKIISMVDEVSYLESQLDTSHNIFADFPFVFPQATPSGQIMAEQVKRQDYSATVNIPENCESCFVMFKTSYHPNWKAYVDGNEVKKYAVFPFYLAVPISTGQHTVQFTYQPNTLKTILLVLEFILGIALIILIFIKRSRLKLSS